MQDTLQICIVHHGFNEHSTIDTLSYHVESQLLDSLFLSMNTVCEHTSTNLGIASWDKYIAFFAAFVTILAFLVAMYELISLWNTRRFYKNCKKLILEDLIRHLIVNIGIIQVIRIKMKEEGISYNTHYPEEGVFQRFQFLPNDYDFHKLSTSSILINDIHELELFMRNYNITADITRVHFTNPSLDERIKQQDLDNLIQRALQIIDKLYILTNKIHTISIYGEWGHNISTHKTFWSICFIFNPLLILFLFFAWVRFKVIELQLASPKSIMTEQYGNIKSPEIELQFPQPIPILDQFLKKHKLTSLMKQYIKLRYENYVTIIPFTSK